MTICNEIGELRLYLFKNYQDSSRLNDACDGTKASYPWIPAIMQNNQDDEVEVEHNTTSKDKTDEHKRENTRNN
jgi:hypothetical protein